MTIEIPNKIFPSVDAATKVADKLNADSDGWSYKVVPNPNASRSTAIIAVYDEDGEFVSYL